MLSKEQREWLADFREGMALLPVEYADIIADMPGIWNQFERLNAIVAALQTENAALREELEIEVKAIRAWAGDSLSGGRQSEGNARLMLQRAERIEKMLQPNEQEG